MFPQIVFEWENTKWPFLDSTPCTLVAYPKNDPNNKATLHFSPGVSEHTVEEHIEGIVGHLIPQLKQ